MRHPVIQFCKFCVTIATLIALVSIGFAHRTSQTPLPPDLAVYVAAGGALGDLCGTAGSDGGVPSVDCDACRLGDNLSLAGLSCPKPVRHTKTTFVLGFVAKRLAESRELDATRLVRAPPRA